MPVGLVARGWRSQELGSGLELQVRSDQATASRRSTNTERPNYRATELTDLPSHPPKHLQIASISLRDSQFDGPAGTSRSERRRPDEDAAVGVGRRIAIGVRLVVCYPHHQIQRQAERGRQQSVRRRMRVEPPLRAVGAKDRGAVARRRCRAAARLSIAARSSTPAVGPDRHARPSSNPDVATGRRRAQHARPVGRRRQIAQRALGGGLGTISRLVAVAKAGADERLCRLRAMRPAATAPINAAKSNAMRTATPRSPDTPFQVASAPSFAGTASLIALLRKRCRRHVARRHVKRDLEVGHVAVATRRTSRAREQTTAAPHVVCGGIEAKLTRTSLMRRRSPSNAVPPAPQTGPSAISPAVNR